MWCAVLLICVRGQRYCLFACTYDTFWLRLLGYDLLQLQSCSSHASSCRCANYCFRLCRQSTWRQAWTALTVICAASPVWTHVHAALVVVHSRSSTNSSPVPHMQVKLRSLGASSMPACLQQHRCHVSPRCRACLHACRPAIGPERPRDHRPHCTDSGVGSARATGSSCRAISTLATAESTALPSRGPNLRWNSSMQRCSRAGPIWSCRPININQQLRQRSRCCVQPTPVRHWCLFVMRGSGSATASSTSCRHQRQR
jgi:hypothetical protein